MVERKTNRWDSLTDRLAKMLSDLEHSASDWSGDPDDTQFGKCPICHQSELQPHRPDCKLMALLKEAGHHNA